MRTLAHFLPLVLVTFLATACPPALNTDPVEEDTAGETTDTKLQDAADTDGVAVECEGEPDCLIAGLCEGVEGIGVCLEGEWSCDYSGVEGYEVDDTACDGVDSDCDGIPDEFEKFSGVTLETACPDMNQGVCAAPSNADSIDIACANVDGDYGWACDFTGIEDDFVEDERLDLDNPGKWCDSLDNDCDGETDEFHGNDTGLDTAELEALSFSPLCPDFVGACSLEVLEGDPQKAWIINSGVAFRCSEGLFECSVDAVEGYEEEEATCDAVDNNCNGETDEGLTIENSPCLYQGVCQGKTEAVCTGGVWVCNYDSLLGDPAFEYRPIGVCDDSIDPLCGAEDHCDGLDNDCDGSIDEGLQWPVYPEDCTDGVDNDGDGEMDCEEPLCAQYHPDCQGSEPIVWGNCPMIEKVTINGVKVDAPVMDTYGMPVLPGICQRSYMTGETSVRMSCEPILSSGTLITSVWKCNYDEVPGYVASEEYTGGDGEHWCDGLDNDCDGTVDDPGEIEISDAMELTPCRHVGACTGNVSAVCNENGASPAIFSCHYDVNSTGLVALPEDCDPNLANCYWEELRCDGKDNDCDGLTDELLDGRKLQLETACAQVAGKGVCLINSLDTKCEFDSVTGSNKFKCDTSNVANYVAVEQGNTGLCDAMDNDCDGQTDEQISATSPEVLSTKTTCLYKGVCGTGTVATCQDGSWLCDYAQVPSFGDGYNYEPSPGVLVEVECDGLDNDCDGSTDEDLTADLGDAAGTDNPKLKSGCRMLGLCSTYAHWSCDVVDDAPQWVCNYNDVPGFQDVETRCDEFDNDCDGEKNEDLNQIGGDDGAPCKTDGVCGTGGVTAQCVDEDWICYYDEVASYDGDKEVTCDGKDNDCDGDTDEDLAWQDTGACVTLGVCNDESLDALCLGTTGWDCLYEILPGYEADAEFSCDSLDNDCDGLVDEAACQFCEPCSEDGNCLTFACNATPFGDSYCSSTGNSCIMIHPISGECIAVADGQRACGTASQPYICASGTWFGNLAECVGNTPVCVDGNCKACYPGERRCDGNEIQECLNGLSWNVEGICAAGQICIGEGTCVNNNEIEVSTQSVAVFNQNNDPQVAALPGGGFVIVYETETAFGGTLDDVVARIYGPSMQAMGPEFKVNTTTAGDQNDPYLATVPSAEGGFIVAWASGSQDGDSLGIFAQRFAADGTKVGGEIPCNETTVGSQQDPAISAFGDGTFAVVWESSEGADPALLGVYGRVFGPDGNPLTSETLLNTTTPDDQYWVDIAALDDGGWGATWTSKGQDADSQAVIFQSFTDTLAKTGGEILVNNYETSGQKHGVIAGMFGLRAGWSALSWESYGQDAGGTGVFMQILNPSGEKVYTNTDIPVNTDVQSGSQRDPAIAISDDNFIIVTWESPSLTGESGTTYGIAAKVFDKDGIAQNDEEFLVNQSVIGEQQNPSVAALENGAYVITWSSVTTPPLAVNIFARVFKLP